MLMEYINLNDGLKLSTKILNEASKDCIKNKTPMDARCKATINNELAKTIIYQKNMLMLKTSMSKVCDVVTEKANNENIKTPLTKNIKVLFNVSPNGVITPLLHLPLPYTSINMKQITMVKKRQLMVTT